MNKKAFTLIELIVTVAVIGILTGLATVSYSGIQERGRDAQRINDLNQIKVALSTYYNAQVPAQYAPSSSPVIADGNNAQIAINGSTDLLSAALEPAYMANVPVDPINPTTVYKYQAVTASSVNTGFKLFATLENKNNKKGWAGGSVWVADGYILQND